MSAILELSHVTKTYAGVSALDDVSISFHEGLTGIVGDNGAGKSTLMKIISGVTIPDRGDIHLNGNKIEIASPVIARNMGIESLYQDLALADTLDVASNIFLGREMTRRFMGIPIVDNKSMGLAARETLDKVRIRIPDVGATVRNLSGGQRQAVALARAVYFNASVFLMDEPTAAFGPKETSAFNEIVIELVKSGKSVIMVTHNIPQVMEMADRIIVMRAGRVVAEIDPQDTNQEELLAFMVGSKTAQ